MTPPPRPGHRPREELELLKLLAARGADRSAVSLSSREIGELLGVSQQTADNYLVDLAELGLINRTLGERKPRLRLTPAGVDRLRGEYRELQRIFESPGPLKLRGLVVSGLGEGRYYLSKPGYVAQFESKLGYTPFPGTLNVRLPRDEATVVAELKKVPGIVIGGFEAEGRSFGGAHCHVARVAGHTCHLIIPDRTHYTDVLEFIAPVNLRLALKLKDQSEVAIEVERP